MSIVSLSPQTLAASAASLFVVGIFVFVIVLMVSTSKVNKNVSRHAKIRVNVDSDRLITLYDASDPYGILTGAEYSGRESGCLPNHADCDGKFYINLPEGTIYDFKKSAIHAYVDDGFAVTNDIDCTSVGLRPYVINREGEDYEVEPKTHCYDMYITVTFDKRANA